MDRVSTIELSALNFDLSASGSDIMKPMHNFSDIKETAGQRLMMGFDGTTLGPDLEFLIRELTVGGIILFARNIETPDQVRLLCRSIQECARACNLPPMFIAIDQEGGVVARLKAPQFKEFPGAPTLKSESEAAQFGQDMAETLAGLGINMNFAPVLDVAPENFPSIMAKRVFGSDPARVSRMGQAIINSQQQKGILSVAKHFPGIGRTTLDSHLDLPELKTDENELAAYDLIPFQGAAAAGVSGIMLSHIRYTGIDPLWPASLSQAIAKDLLRRRMGYTGLVMTDDLDMGAIQNHYDIATIMRRILTADVDLALICHQGPKIAAAFAEIKQNLANDAGLKQKHKQSLARIMQWKSKFLEHQL